MPTNSIRIQLIKAGVSNLKAFGYSNVTEENILTDEIYKAFFKEMLKDNLCKGFDKPINQLLQQLK